jgi:hypothetical protein
MAGYGMSFRSGYIPATLKEICNSLQLILVPICQHISKINGRLNSRQHLTLSRSTHMNGALCITDCLFQSTVPLFLLDKDTRLREDTMYATATLISTLGDGRTVSKTDTTSNFTELIA